MTTTSSRAAKLPRADRRKQLIEVARSLLKQDGSDGLTLGNLAVQAGVSKPVVYDHFPTRNALLVELYKTIDAELTAEMQQALTLGNRPFESQAHELADAYMRCASDTSGEWHLLRAALAGSNEERTVDKELLAGYVQMFVNVLRPYTSLDLGRLYVQCIGFVGAADALSMAMLQGRCLENEAADTLANLVISGLPVGAEESKQTSDHPTKSKAGVNEAN